MSRRKRLVKYGLTEKQYRLRMAFQEGLCMICRKEPAGYIDHNHRTGAVRALLCRGCNSGLGHFKDDPIRLRRAADYLELYP